jgi:hypothetical protein
VENSDIDSSAVVAQTDSIKQTPLDDYLVYLSRLFMKKWFRLMDLALLGLITVHLIVWQMLLVCAGSPIKPLRSSSKTPLEDNKLQLDNDYGRHKNSDQMSLPMAVQEVTRLSNNVSYEFSTNTNSKVSHVFNNYLRVVSIDEGEQDGGSRGESKSQISSIYEIFLINKRSNTRQLRSAQSNPKMHNSKSKRVKGGGGGGGVGGGSRSTLDRNERSANLSHITGSARKIQLYIKNRFLQLLPDGTVNGTTDDLSDYSESRFSFLFLVSSKSDDSF